MAFGWTQSQLGLWSHELHLPSAVMEKRPSLSARLMLEQNLANLQYASCACLTLAFMCLLIVFHTMEPTPNRANLMAMGGLSVLLLSVNARTTQSLAGTSHACSRSIHFEFCSWDVWRNQAVSSRHDFDTSLLILAEVDNAPLDKPLYVTCHLMSSTCDLLLRVMFTHDHCYDNWMLVTLV